MPYLMLQEIARAKVVEAETILWTMARISAHLSRSFSELLA
jgi:hypothetical protein